MPARSSPSSRDTRARPRRTARSRPSRVPISSTCSPPRSPARSAITAYLRRCASASDWPGRVEDRARVGHRLVEEQAVEVVAEVVVRLDVAAAAGPRVPPRRGGRGSARSRNGSRHQPSGSASASRFQRGDARAAPAGRGSTTGRPCTPRRRRRRRPSSIRTTAAVSWMWISPTSLATGSPNTRRCRSGSHDGQPSDTDPSRGAEHDPSSRRAPSSRRRADARAPAAPARLTGGLIGARPPAADGRAHGGRTARRAATAAARASGSVRSSAAVSSGWRTSIRSSVRSVSGTRRRTRLVLSSGAPSWRSAIAIRRPSCVVADVNA